MTEKAKQKHKYGQVLDITQLPITHNHMIGAIKAISLDNVRGTIALIRRMVVDADGKDLHLSNDETNGLACILENTVEALRFEQDYRGKGVDDVK